MAIILLFNQPICKFLRLCRPPRIHNYNVHDGSHRRICRHTLCLFTVQTQTYKICRTKILNISLNIVLNLLYLIILPGLKLNLFGIYDAHFTLDVVWVFYINLIVPLSPCFCFGKNSMAYATASIKAHANVCLATLFHC